MQNYFSTTLPLIEKAVQTVLPKTVSVEWIGKDIDRLPYHFNAQNWEEAISKPFYTLFQRGGKRIRPILACLTYHAFGGNSEEIYTLAAISEIIHNGTLIIDDIEDHSALRRGEKTIHKVFPENIAINNGNFLYFFPQLILQKRNLTLQQKLQIYETIQTEMTKLHLGQGMDILWSNTKNYAINMDDYLQMSVYKTGTLLNVALQIGGIFSNQAEEQLQQLKKLAYNLGLAFQIQDDLLNLEKSEKWGKTYGEDIQEGKLTYLVAATLEVANQTEKQEFIKLLKKEKNTSNEIEKAVEIMRKNGSFIKAENFCQNLITESNKILENFKFEVNYQEIWNKMLKFIIQRKS